MVGAAIVGSAVVGGVASSKASKKAANSQTDAAQMGVNEQRYQFDKVVELLKPYVDAGEKGLQGQQDLLGLGTPEAQQAVIDQLQQSPQYTSLVRSGEEAMLQNAAATGGLRGGNLEESLLRFRPELLSNMISQQYNRLGDLTAMGQASAAGQAQLGQRTGENIANLYGNMGAAKAQNYIAQGQAIGNVANSFVGGGIMGGWF